jgi:hypothetical protein
VATLGYRSETRRLQVYYTVRFVEQSNARCILLLGVLPTATRSLLATTIHRIARLYRADTSGRNTDRFDVEDFINGEAAVDRLPGVEYRIGRDEGCPIRD